MGLDLVLFSDNVCEHVSLYLSLSLSVCFFKLKMQTNYSVVACVRSSTYVACIAYLWTSICGVCNDACAILKMKLKKKKKIKVENEKKE